MTMRADSAPARCPSMRGRWLWRAQRPFPSMMMATCRGNEALASGLRWAIWALTTCSGRLQLGDRRSKQSEPIANNQQRFAHDFGPFVPVAKGLEQVDETPVKGSIHHGCNSRDKYGTFFTSLLEAAWLLCGCDRRNVQT
jgi:hypothetical protein